MTAADLKSLSVASPLRWSCRRFEDFGSYRLSLRGPGWFVYCILFDHEMDDPRVLPFKLLELKHQIAERLPNAKERALAMSEIDRLIAERDAHAKTFEAKVQQMREKMP